MDGSGNGELLMLNALISDGDQAWLHSFFFDGPYPLALQLGVINGLCVIIAVLSRTNVGRSVLRPATARAITWLVLIANFFLIINKDYHFLPTLS